MFILKRPHYIEGVAKPHFWTEVDRDEDYGALLSRNLVAGQTVGALSFSEHLTYLVFTDETIMKVEWIPEDTLDS